MATCDRGLYESRTYSASCRTRGALAEAFAGHGAGLVLHSRSPSREWAAQTEELSQRCGVQVERLHFDLTDAASMKAAVDAAFPVGQAIDVLVNNAGIAHGGLFQMTPMLTIRGVFDVNFFAQMELTQLIVRRMVRRKTGSIVNMGSIAGQDLASGNVAYGVSKAALMAFTQTLAAEVGPAGVRVNAVAPGLTDTDMAGQMESKAGARMIEASAMKRMAHVDEIARAVMFLASDAASFVNGQILRIDGGRA